MKKKLVIINAIILVIALLVFLLLSTLIVNYYSRKSSEKDLKNHISLIVQIYDGNNADEVINMYKTTYSNLRISFISFDGTVLKDSSGILEFQSHDNRPEIKDLGNVYTRYSKTLDKQMLYVAYKDSGLYVRVAMPQRSITAVVNNILLFSLLSLILLTSLSIVVLNSVNKKAFMPLTAVVNKLSAVAGHEGYYGDDIDTISYHIDDINKNINDKINDIIDEKSKIDFIINNLNQGVIVVDSNRKLILVNDYVLKVKNFRIEEVLNKDYIYLIRDIYFQDMIAETIDNGTITTFDLQFGNITFLVNITPVDSKWTVLNSEKNGAFITINNVSNERKIEKMKREFFANASHELKSPLTTIIGYQQMITEGIITSPEDILDASRRTNKEASRMHHIILEMLELSKLESKEEAKLEELNINNILTDVLEQFNNDIVEKRLELITSLEEMCLIMNYSHLYQLVRNLVENAIKYNVDGGKLEISISKKNREFIVRDTGVGISSQEQSRIFERFYRVDKARSKDQGGTGLGLSIVKHICTLYNADIFLTSKLNKGTTIKIQFK